MNGQPQVNAPLEPSKEEVTKWVVNAILDGKGKDVAVLDVSETCDFADHFIIASGRSDRQVQGLAQRVLSELEAHKVKPLATEGLDRGHWVLIDLEDVIVHVFYEGVRGHYDMESLWLQAKRLSVEDITAKKQQRELQVA